MSIRKVIELDRHISIFFHCISEMILHYFWSSYTFFFFLSCPRLCWTHKVFVLPFIQGLSLGKESSNEAGKDILNYLQGEI